MMDGSILIHSKLFEMEKFFQETFQQELIPITLLFIGTLLLLNICLNTCLKISKKEKNGADEWSKVPRFSFFRIVKTVLGIARDPKTVFQQVLRVADDMGPIFRFNLLGEENVFLNRPELAERLLSSKNIGHFPKSLTGNAPIIPIFGDGLVFSQGEYWQSQRKLMSKAFTYSALRNYTKTYNKCAKRLVLKLDSKFRGKEVYQSFNTMLLECGLDIICETVMGLDSLLYEKEARIIAESFNRVKALLAYKYSRWWLLTMPLLWKLHPLSKEHDQKVVMINSTIKKIIARYQESVEDSKVNKDQDSSDHMMELMVKSDMTENQILDEVKTMIMSGYETVNVTTQFLLFMLAVHQNHQKACREVVDRIFDNCPTGHLTMEDLSEMKYVERCFHETQRLYPVVHMITRKLEAPLKLNENLQLPVGVNVIVPIMAYQRSSEHFPQPDEFNPDRFLPENCVGRHSHAFLGFSSGPRVCIGIKFAILEAKTVVAHILREFEVYTCDKVDDVSLLPSILLMPERDYLFKLKRRYHRK